MLVIACRVNLRYFTNYKTAFSLLLLSIVQDHMELSSVCLTLGILLCKHVTSNMCFSLLINLKLIYEHT